MQNSFDREDLQAPLAEINMTPLVDVMLVLLVIFLITAPMLSSAIKLNLPNETASEIIEKTPVTVSLSADGQYYINDRQLSFEDLKQELNIVARDNLKRQIYIRADVDVNYGEVSHILALLQGLGLSNIGFITEAH